MKFVKIFFYVFFLLLFSSCGANTKSDIKIQTSTPSISIEPTKTPIPCGPNETFSIHNIKFQETVGSIAMEYGIMVEELALWNCLELENGFRLRVGDSLYVPKIENSETIQIPEPIEFPPLPLSFTGSIDLIGDNGIYGGGWKPNVEINILIRSPNGDLKQEITIITDEDGEIPSTNLPYETFVSKDLISITIENDEVEFVYQALNVIVDFEAGYLNGNAEPFLPLKIVINPGTENRHEIKTVAERNGDFSAEFNSSWNVGPQMDMLIGQEILPDIWIYITNLRPEFAVVDLEHVFIPFKAPNNFEPTGWAAILIDLDSDGDLDLVAPQLWEQGTVSSPILAFRNDGNGYFTEDTNEIFGNQLVEAIMAGFWAVEDFNGDGLDDLFLADTGLEIPDVPGGQSQIFIQNENGQLINETKNRIPQKLAFTHSMSVGDIDSDGDIDIFMDNWVNGYEGNWPQFYLNDGAGFFTADSSRLPNDLLNWRKANSANLLVDIDNDDDLDLIISYPRGTEQLRDSLLLNDGTGYFTYAVDTSLPVRLTTEDLETMSLTTIDFNLDGWSDIILSVTHVVPNPVSWNDLYTNPKLQLLQNNGDGTFSDQTNIIDLDWMEYVFPDMNEYISISWLLVIDSNGDEWPDILAVSEGTSHLLLENVEGKGFSIAENFSDLKLNNNFPIWVIPGDVNGDNILDYVLLYHGSYQQVLIGK